MAGQDTGGLPPMAPIMVDGYGQPGGYHFDAEQVDAVIKGWQDGLEKTKTDLNQAIVIENVQAPAQEFSSVGFIDQHARPTGKSLVEQHNAMIAYIENYITALTAAKNKITVAEQEARDAMKPKTGL